MVGAVRSWVHLQRYAYILRVFSRIVLCVGWRFANVTWTSRFDKSFELRLDCGSHPEFRPLSFPLSFPFAVLDTALLCLSVLIYPCLSLVFRVLRVIFYVGCCVLLVVFDVWRWRTDLCLISIVSQIIFGQPVHSTWTLRLKATGCDRSGKRCGWEEDGRNTTEREREREREVNICSS